LDRSLPSDPSLPYVGDPSANGGRESDLNILSFECFFLADAFLKKKIAMAGDVNMFFRPDLGDGEFSIHCVALSVLILICLLCADGAELEIMIASEASQRKGLALEAVTVSIASAVSLPMWPSLFCDDDVDDKYS
jgi:hypothetical protein